MSALLVLAASLGLVGSLKAEPCPRQAMPPGFEALSPRPDHQVIAFAVARDMVLPRRAWAVRLSRRGYTGPAIVEVARLRGQLDCNRYDIVQQWQSNVSAQEFDGVARRMAPHVLAARSSADDNPLTIPAEVAIDGTAITLRLSNASWESTRQLVAEGPDGSVVSAAFRALISRIVPVQDQPPQGW